MMRKRRLLELDANHYLLTEHLSRTCNTMTCEVLSVVTLQVPPTLWMCLLLVQETRDEGLESLRLVTHLLSKHL